MDWHTLFLCVLCRKQMDAYDGARQLPITTSVAGVGRSTAIGIRKRLSSFATTYGERVANPDGSIGVVNSATGAPIVSSRAAKPATGTLISFPSGAR